MSNQDFVSSLSPSHPLSDISGFVVGVSPLEKDRLQYAPLLPKVLSHKFNIVPGGGPTSAAGDQEKIKQLFPLTYGQRAVQFLPATSSSSSSSSKPPTPLKIGIILSGGPAPGGHNVISGVFDYLLKHVPNSKLIGFLDGPSGLVDNKFIEITTDIIDSFRNQGGFHLIGSGRTKIETEKQFLKSRTTINAHKLDGLIIVGGDDSNTNAAVLAEHLLAFKVGCRVIGVPKTIDGDLRNEYVETSFGFDTATKVYAEKVAALAADAASARKTWHFCRLMGRTASHITLEVALQTHPNVALIGEEIQKRGLSLSSVTSEVCDIIVSRAASGKHYGVLILPEGLIDFCTDIAALLHELNELLVVHGGVAANIAQHLTDASRALFASLPPQISQQLLMDRDPHGNVQVSKIESERLLAYLVEAELSRRKKSGAYKGSPSIVCHFLGYEGRCGLPSNFDCNYCYTLGHAAAALIEAGYTGMMAIASDLSQSSDRWHVGGMPLTHMMNLERRSGHDKPVIRKALVELDDRPFKLFNALRDEWKLNDAYRNPGSIQYFVQHSDANCNLTLRIERHGKEFLSLHSKL